MSAYGVAFVALLAILAAAGVARLALGPGAPAAGGRDAAGRWLARNYVALVFAAVALVLVYLLAIGLWRVPFVVNPLLTELEASRTNPEATRAVVAALAAALAAVGIFGAIIVGAIRVWTNERQTAASERQTATIEQGHVTDRLTKAVEQLGAEKAVKRVLRDADGAELRDGRNVPVVVEATEPNLEVRLGAIYALERIAQDSERDHVTVMEILCAYVRENAKARDAQPPPIPDLAERTERDGLDDRRAALREREASVRAFGGSLRPPRVDVQAALTVIGRRDDARIGLETSRRFRLDLRNTNLRRADLREARLEGADLFGARLEGANLREARLEGANLSEARLEGAHLSEARLEGANLREARLEGANLRRADFRNSNWAGASNRASPAQFADFRGGQDLTQAQLEHIIGNEETLLPDWPNENGEAFHVWSCWETPPANIEALLKRAEPIDEDVRARLRAEWVCGPDNPRRKTGTPLALDAPYPDGQPLADRD